MGVAVVAMSQTAFAAKPTMMLLPDDGWCVRKGYATEELRNGKTKVVCDYAKAFMDRDFENVQAAIEKCFIDIDYQLIDAKRQDEGTDDDEMFDEVYAEKESVNRSGADDLLMRAKPDIVLYVSWDTNYSGSTYNTNVRIKGVDTYSRKTISQMDGNTGSVSRITALNVSMKQAVKNNMDDFISQLQSHFDDMQEKGREIRLTVDTKGGVDLESEYGGEELGDIIYNWVNDNTVNHQFTRASNTENRAAYTQVRIPLRDSKGMPMDAQLWCKGLQKKLKGLGLSIQNRPRGLGYGYLYVGSK